MDSKTFTLQGVGANNGVANAAVFRLPRPATLVGVTKNMTGAPGTVTAHAISLNIGGNFPVAGVCARASNGGVSWKTKHLGGTHDAVELPADTDIGIDINQTGAGTADVFVDLQLLHGEA